MPRRGDLRETRNDHPIATPTGFREQGAISVAMDEDELVNQVKDLDKLTASGQIPRWASDSLLASVHDFIESDGS